MVQVRGRLVPVIGWRVSVHDCVECAWSEPQFCIVEELLRGADETSRAMRRPGESEGSTSETDGLIGGRCVSE